MRLLILLASLISPAILAEVDWDSADAIRDGLATMYEDQSGESWTGGDFDQVHEDLSQLFVDIHNFSFEVHTESCSGRPQVCTPDPDNVSITTLNDSIDLVTDQIIDDMFGTDDASNWITFDGNEMQDVTEAGFMNDELNQMVDSYNDHFNKDAGDITQSDLDSFSDDWDSVVDDYNDAAGTLRGGWAASLSSFIDDNSDEDGSAFDSSDYLADFETTSVIDDLDDSGRIIHSGNDDYAYGDIHFYTDDFATYEEFVGLSISAPIFEHDGTYQIPDQVSQVSVLGAHTIRVTFPDGVYRLHKEDGEWQIQDNDGNEVTFEGYNPASSLQDALYGLSRYAISECRDGDNFSACADN